ncbi:b(o/a)3-type cytochrome-c oxidase subunit 1 [Tumebacillus sp. DT12]|uniref:B(O/a)3-type cytochrome-c oxidase subunit 1 n=1 Tax=Tumebacillus lacus TaxID=2995335 RepID=A0ABT3WWQ2_9BACL|nr:b(o/a)3-type cytochrome-c oxidase subunit 1 [Tumebacillus lacus]MCX7569113.1 b(o/a)3-type cytochrome-c oxidase subunit 1 [Tumebacillus lacus]
MIHRGIEHRAADLSLAYVLVAYLAFGVAALAGLLQGLVRGGMIELPEFITYYDILTAHGVLMGLVFTTFFIIGFLFSGMAKTMGGLTPTGTKLGWIGWAMMFFGTAMGTATILTGEAAVLYTFYAPMKATPWFYIGAALLIIGSWVAGFGMIHSYRHWRKNNEGKLSPLFAFMAISTMVLWLIATLGVAAEVVLQLIPWSFGWTDKINVVLSRMLFWFFGHPLVYFWLMPAYVAWYAVLPKIIGGKVFSDSLARLAFVLLILFSIPVGFHHQLMDPGISSAWKYVHVVLTLAVVLPSLMTAFSMFAVFENRGRAMGAKGLFGWFAKLPWKDVRFFAPMLGMLFFIPAGIGGIINASNQMNQVVHNTIWVTGHFHLTVGTSVTLTFFGITYWLIPTLTGREMSKRINALGIIQTLTWAIGMLIMSGSMHFMGLLGVPRRTAFTTYLDHVQALKWISYQKLMAIGGVFLFIAAALMVGIVLYLWLFAKKGVTEYPIAENETISSTPRLLERWPVWVTISLCLILIAYGYPIYDVIQNAPPGSPGVKTW